METSCAREAMGIMPQSITLDHLLTDSDILLSRFLAFSSTTINKTYFLKSRNDRNIFPELLGVILR